MELRHNGILVEHFESREDAQNYLDERAMRLLEQHPNEPPETGWTIEGLKPFVLKAFGMTIGTFATEKEARLHREKHIEIHAPHVRVSAKRPHHPDIRDLKHWSIEER